MQDVLKHSLKHITRLACLLFLLFPVSFCGATDAIIVRSPDWSPALTKWKQYREAQGLQIVELDSDSDPVVIRDAIRAIAKESEVKFVVLAGDVNPNSPHHIPTFYKTSKAMVQHGGDPVLGTDNPYVDLDEDGIPDVAIGRIPADQEQQLASYLDRVIDYEQQTEYLAWQRDIDVVAGVGGFGPLIDSVIEMTTRRFLSDRVPGWSRLSMTHASPSSIYCPDMCNFSAACLNKLNSGAKFFVYIGHGHVQTLDYIRLPEGGVAPIFDHRSLPEVDCAHASIALFLACYTGAFDATVDSLAEELVLHDNGPIATIAATRVSGPYGLAMLSDGLLTNLYESEVATLGELMLNAKRNMTSGPHAHDADKSQKPTPQIRMINAIATAMSPQDYDLFQERIEHVQMMHLLGDPMLQVAHPDIMEVLAPETAQPGERITIAGTSHFAGTLKLELIFRRDQTRKDLTGRPVAKDRQQAIAQLQKRYEAANNRVIRELEFDCSSGPFETTLEIPSDLRRGKYAIRVFMPGEDQFQVGYAEVSIREPARTPTESK